MAGWVIDIVVDFFVRLIYRQVTLYRTRHWPTSEAKVTELNLLSPVLGCTKAQVVYAYQFDGRSHSGKFEKPFLFDSGAKSYLSEFGVGNTLIVRVNPNKSDKSCLLDRDYPPGFVASPTLKS